MEITFLKFFDKAYSKLSHIQQDQVYLKIDQILKIVEKKEKNNSGIRIKKLAEFLFEARVDIHIRILFYIKSNQLIFSYIGNHDEVKRYLKAYRKKRK